MKILAFFLFFMIGFCEETLKKKQITMVVHERKLFTDMIKKITHHPLMTVLIIILIMYAFCCESSQVLCVTSMLMDLFKTITRSWPKGRKLKDENDEEFQQLLPILQTSKNYINERNIEKHYKEMGRFLKDNFFDITADQFNKKVYLDIAEAYYNQKFKYEIPDLEKNGFMKLADSLYVNRYKVKEYFNKNLNEQSIQIIQLKNHSQINKLTVNT